MTESRARRRLSYGDFDLSEVLKQFELAISSPILYEQVMPLQPSQWLQDVLNKGVELSTVSEKARSEFVVAPILLYVRELHHNQMSIHSGVRFDVDPERGLRGTCDFIISRTPMLPIVQAPVFMLVEAKKNDIEEGFGQCVAEMVAAQIFNQREGNPVDAIYGCVTTGDRWQFLKLVGNKLELDQKRYFLNDLPEILGILDSIVTGFVPA